MRLLLIIFIHISNFLSIFGEKLADWELNFYTANFITGLSIASYLAIDNIYLQLFGVRIIEIGDYIVLISIMYGLSVDALILLIVHLNKSELNNLRNRYKDKKSLLYSKIKGIGVILFVILLFIFSALLTLSK